jgi:hypothetical protein
VILLVHQSLLVLIIVCSGRVPFTGCPERTSEYFDVDKESFESLTIMCGRPYPRPEGMERFRYFWECSGRLLLVEADMLNDSLVHVRELVRDQYL